ncbi:MAG: hypothetical protein ACTSYI_00295 [Promethearchaeota archaeon]
MLIDIPPENLDKPLTKLVAKINQLHDKGKNVKIEPQVQKILEVLKSNPSNANVYLYIISILAEELPEIIPSDLFSYLESYLQEGSLKERVNTIITLGWWLLYQFDQNNDIDSGMVRIFIQLLEDSDAEIRSNTAYFLEKFPDTASAEFMIQIRSLVDCLQIETDAEVLGIVSTILHKIQPKLSLRVIKKYLDELITIYEGSTNSSRNDAILSLLIIEIPPLADKVKKRASKKEILRIINQHPPFVRYTDLHQLAEEESMDVEDVESYMRDELDDALDFVLFYTEKHHKKMIHFDKAELFKFLSETKIDLLTIHRTFQHIGITNSAIGAILIRDLMDKGEIRGFLSQDSFYSGQYIRNEIISILRKNGTIDLVEIRKRYEPRLIDGILAEIIDEEIFEGIYDISKSQYFTFPKLTRDIENIMTRKNVIDLKPYRDQFGQENFLRLEQFCRDKFFTGFHTDHIWLTNLGLTRIQQSISTCEQIGEVDLDKIASELEIPVEIYRKVVKPVFKKKNGFWNREKSRFFFSKQVKKRIAEIQRESNKEVRESKIKALAMELQIDEEEIASKVDEKLNTIASRLMTLDVCEFKPLMRDLQMDYKELLEFIDSLNRPDGYIIIGNRIIFSKAKIESELAKLEKFVLESYERNEVLKISVLATRLKCSAQMIIDIIKSHINEGDIKGLWLIEDELYLTLHGIKNRMGRAEGFIDLHSFIEERAVTETELDFLEHIIKDLIVEKQLKGVYDEDSLMYQSQDVAGQASLVTERERFLTEFLPHVEDLEMAYVFLKEILTKDDIHPGDIEEYDDILAKTLRKIFSDETMIKRMMHNANQRLNRLRTSGEHPASKIKRDRKGKKSSDAKSENRIDLKEDEEIAGVLNDFANWKEIILAIEQKKGEIVFMKKKLKRNPDDEETRQKLQSFMDYLGFSD